MSENLLALGQYVIPPGAVMQVSEYAAALFVADEGCDIAAHIAGLAATKARLLDEAMAASAGDQGFADSAKRRLHILSAFANNESEFAAYMTDPDAYAAAHGFDEEFDD